MSRYGGNTPDINNASRIKIISKSIKQIDADTVEQQQILQFLVEQLALVYAARKGRRYLTDMLILAFTWYHKSTACYHINQRHMILPTVRLLRDVASYLNIEHGFHVSV